MCNNKEGLIPLQRTSENPYPINIYGVEGKLSTPRRPYIIVKEDCFFLQRQLSAGFCDYFYSRIGKTRTVKTWICSLKEEELQQ